MKLRFSVKYFLATVVLFMIELSIATVFRNLFFVRAFLGDVIAVVFLFTLILSFIKVENKNLLILGVFVFACLLEFGQYFHLAELLGFKKGSIMYIVIGNSFAWEDILCYFAGCVLLYIFVKFEK